MNAILNKRIAIVGGGPGGLTLARLLQQKGAQVKVYERDFNEKVRTQGATLDLHEESGLAALEEAGLMEAFKANYRPGADRMRIADNQGTIVFDEHTMEKSDLFRPEIDRGPLRQILMDSLEPGTIVWDHPFQTMQRSGEGWRLEFQKGRSAEADLVIAADGANSHIRPFITPIKAFYSGYTIVEGSVYHSETTVPALHELLKGGKVFALGNDKTLILSSKGDGSLVFYAGCKTDEDWVKKSGIDFNDRRQLRRWFDREFAEWAPFWADLFEKAELPFIPRPLYCMPLDQHWEALPNLTMLGDAAHLMPPYAGEGVNMAMQDALELSRCLCNPEFKDTRSAIAAYEEQMRSRASEIARVTLEQTDAMHAPQALEGMLAMFTQE